MTPAAILGRREEVFALENVIVVFFNEESKAYQALSELKSRSIAPDYTVSEAAVVKKENGRIVFKDGYNFDTGFGGRLLAGSLIGSFVGILGGPFGILLGGSIGSLIGASLAGSKAEEKAGILELTADSLAEGESGLVALAQEERIDSLNTYFHSLDSRLVLRRDVEDVEDELVQAREAEEEMAKEARQKLRDKRQNELRDRAENVRDRIREEFEQFRERFRGDR
ncbi:hypothetical protein B9G55_18310 [Saccharibacillus sp. O16]|nr:hypothetical protein B9G55_18310 [Saccharibacillus sp. O16]